MGLLCELSKPSAELKFLLVKPISLPLFSCGCELNCSSLLPCKFGAVCASWVEVMNFGCVQSSPCVCVKHLWVCVCVRLPAVYISVSVLFGEL